MFLLSGLRDNKMKMSRWPPSKHLLPIIETGGEIEDKIRLLEGEVSIRDLHLDHLNGLIGIGQLLEVEDRKNGLRGQEIQVVERNAGTVIRRHI